MGFFTTVFATAGEEALGVGAQMLALLASSVRCCFAMLSVTASLTIPCGPNGSIILSQVSDGDDDDCPEVADGLGESLAEVVRRSEVR